MRGSSSSYSPPPACARDGDAKLAQPPPQPRRGGGSAAAAADDVHAVLLPARRWVGWEEDVVPPSPADNGRHRPVVRYYLRRGGGGGGGRDGDSGGGEGVGRGNERELAVVGLQRGPRHMVYKVHARFLRSLEVARASSPAPPAPVEASQLRWKSAREVMDWLTSLVSDYTYVSSVMDDSDHDSAKLAGISTSKDLSSTIAGNNSEDFTWLSPMLHSKKQQKHYRSFCRRGITISIHDFVYIFCEEKMRLVAYVEDLYEDVKTNKMVLVRWFHKVDEIGDLFSPVVNDREIFFSYSLQDLRVECIDGLAAVLNAQHFEKFQKSAKHSDWQPYLCYRQIDNGDIKPFDITQLQGYSDQEILRTSFRAPSSLKVRFKASNANKPSPDGGPKRKRDTTDDQTVESHASQNAVSDHTVGSRPLCIATHVQTIRNHALSDTVNDLTVENNDQTVEHHAPCDTIHHQTVENRPDSCNARTDQTVDNHSPHNAANDHTVEKHPPSGGSSSGLVKCILNRNPEQQLQLPENGLIEVLSQDSGIRGCWFRCLILKRRNDQIKVRYQDLQSVGKAGNLEEWLLTERIADPDPSGLRFSGRPMIRPQHSQRSKITSTADVGTIVDAWWHDGWWEGIVVQQETVGRVRVYFPGEKRVAEFYEGDLRHSLEWIDNKWNPLKERKDIACQLPPNKAHVHQAKPQESEIHANKIQKLSLKSNKGDDKCAKPVGQKATHKGDDNSATPVEWQARLQSDKSYEKSSKPVAQKALLKSSQNADSISSKLMVKKPSLQYREKGDDESARPDPKNTTLQSSKTNSDEPAIPAAGEKIIPDDKAPAADLTDAPTSASLKCNDKTVCKEVGPDHKQHQVDLEYVLRFDSLKWTAHKARGSFALWDYPDEASFRRSHTYISKPCPPGDLELVNPVPEEDQ